MYKYKIKRQSLYFSVQQERKQKPGTKSIIFYYNLENGYSLKVTRNLTETSVTTCLKCPQFVCVNDKMKGSEKTKTVKPESITLKDWRLLTLWNYEMF